MSKTRVRVCPRGDDVCRWRVSAARLLALGLVFTACTDDEAPTIDGAVTTYADGAVATYADGAVATYADSGVPAKDAGGPTDGIPATDDAGAGVASVCTAIAEAICGRVGVCTNGRFFAYYDAETCRSRATIDCEARLALPGAAGSGALLACARTVSAASCQDLHFFQQWEDEVRNTTFSLEEALRLCAIAGARPKDAPCASALQCETGLCLGSSSAASACGRCGGWRPAGEACDRYSAPCGEGLYCRTQFSCGPGGCEAVGSRCEPLGGPGASCPVLQMSNESWSVGCQLGHHCVSVKDQSLPPTSEPRGQCRALGDVGAPCRPDTHPGCDSFRGLFCDPATMKCAASPPAGKPAYRAHGEACPSIPELYATKPCAYPASCVEGVCATVPLCSR